MVQTTTSSGKPLADELELIVNGRHGDPHRILGRHDGKVRAFRPDAVAMWLLPEADGAVAGAPAGRPIPMRRIHPGGVFEAPIPAGVSTYRLQADYPMARVGGSNGTGVVTYVFDDAYRAWPTLGDLDLHLFGEGRHRRLWDVLGAHPRVHDGMAGVSFAVWAPNAQAVRVVGDWNLWDGRVHPMRSLGASGVWELFVPGAAPGDRYKFELVTAEGRMMLRADPMARQAERPPARPAWWPRPRGTSGAIRTGRPGGPPRTCTGSRCRSTRSTWDRGDTPTTVPVAPDR
jgi:1,4-alpha-glucan branching enzyme